MYLSILLCNWDDQYLKLATIMLGHIGNNENIYKVLWHSNWNKPFSIKNYTMQEK